MESFYKTPNPKKKKLKSSLDLTTVPSLTALCGSPHYGILWGGNVWINDHHTITLLTDNGCYGNSVMNRHSTNQDSRLSLCEEKEETGRECDVIKEDQPFIDKGEVPDREPPNKKPKLCNNEEIDGGFYNDIILNSRSYHTLFQEEAFYLIQKSCLSIKNINGEILTIRDIWRKMMEYDDMFIVKYPAYEYFRDKGWVPKCGTKFGVDYLLYEKGPMYNHSSYSVIMCQEHTQSEPTATGSDDTIQDGRPSTGYLTWQDVIAAGRVNEGAKKEIVICYINNIDEQLYKDGNWLTNSDITINVEVKCIVTKRWLIEKDRQLL